MTIQKQIHEYISSQAETKRSDLSLLHTQFMKLFPKGKLWFLDGTDDTGKVVSNPNIGYGHLKLTYAHGKSKDFYQIGLSANSSGISIYVMGLKDKTYLRDTFGKSLGKASITGYCIKFKTLKDIDREVLETVLRDVVNQTSVTRDS